MWYHRPMRTQASRYHVIMFMTDGLWLRDCGSIPGRSSLHCFHATAGYDTGHSFLSHAEIMNAYGLGSNPPLFFMVPILSQINPVLSLRYFQICFSIFLLLVDMSSSSVISSLKVFRLNKGRNLKKMYVHFLIIAQVCLSNNY
jgi:hypothetical protein